jgi:hypothetical protein
MKHLSSKQNLKALSIKQPWVHAILREGKDVENRCWKRDFRGWFAIHASAVPNRFARYPKAHKIPPLETLHYSAICGVARIVDMVSKSKSKWFDRPTRTNKNYGWVIRQVKPLKRPIPCKGALGLWDVSPRILKEIKKQLPGNWLET